MLVSPELTSICFRECDTAIGNQHAG